MKRWLLPFIIFVLVFGSLLAYDHRESSCFNSPTCVLERAGLDKENLLLIYKDPARWVAITYTDGTLREVQVTLKREFPTSKIVVNERAVKTEINYSPLVFSIRQIPHFPQREQFLAIKVNGTVTVLKGEELEHVLRNTPKLEGILEKCNNCTLIFGDKSNRPGVDSNPLIGGYLVFPTKVKCGYSTWITVVKDDNSAGIIAVYPLMGAWWKLQTQKANTLYLGPSTPSHNLGQNVRRQGDHHKRIRSHCKPFPVQTLGLCRCWRKKKAYVRGWTKSQFTPTEPSKPSST